MFEHMEQSISHKTRKPGYKHDLISAFFTVSSGSSRSRVMTDRAGSICVREFKGSADLAEPQQAWRDPVTGPGPDLYPAIRLMLPEVCPG